MKDVKEQIEEVVEVVVPTIEKKETIATKVGPAVVFKLKHGYSKTMSKLMKKYNCKSVEEYRIIRKRNRKSK